MSWVVAGLTLASAARGQDILFEKDVLPILNAQCASCHGGYRQKQNLDVRTPAKLLQGGDSGPALVLGKANASLLWKRLATDRTARLVEELF